MGNTQENWKELTDRAEKDEVLKSGLRDFDAVDKRLESVDGAGDDSAYAAPYSNPRRFATKGWR